MLRKSTTLLIILALLCAGCSKRAATQPSTPREPRAITDATLAAIATQTERAVGAVEAIGAIKRGALKDRLINVETSRAITLASQQILNALEELNARTMALSRLDPQSRATIRELIAAVSATARNLSNGALTRIANGETRARIAVLIRTIDGAIQTMSRLLEEKSNG